MSSEQDRPVRVVIPRRTMLAGGLAVLAAAPALAQTHGQAHGAAAGGGEGEGGEGAALAEGDAAVALLTALGLVEGHLRAGAALYAAGESNLAVTHMKHPGDEIYADLVPMLEAAGAEGFAPELEALAAAVEGRADPAAVAEAESAVMARIEAARQAAGATPYQQARAIEALMRTAAEEYAIGIVDGAVANLHEYQDAWGFVQVAKDQVAKLAGTSPEAAAAMEEALAPTDAIFPGLVPEGAVEGDAAVLLGAAARIELAGLQLR